MSDDLNRGNFRFIQPMNSDICQYLSEAESISMLDYTEAGNLMRKALEELCKNLFEEFGITRSGNDLSSDCSDLKSAGKLYMLNDGKYYTQNYKCKGGATWTIRTYWYDFIRLLGNTSVHIPGGTPDDNPAANYNNVVKGLELFFNVMKSEYKRKRAKNNLPQVKIPAHFDKDIMPIRDHYIMKKYEPIDKMISDCEEEFLTCRIDDNGGVDFYSIVRVYNWKNKRNQTLLSREKDALSEIMRNSALSIDGNVQLEDISSMSNSASDFYIVGYKFYSSVPEPLTDEFLKTMDLSEREELCRQISKIVYQFHQMTPPFYIRNLSYDSIYVCRNRNGSFTASIIKMDCAKLDDERYKTVIENVKKLSDADLIREESILKYARDPLVNPAESKNNSSKKEWDLLDIYDLGVLVGDILKGTTQNTNPVSGAEIVNMISPKLKEFAEDMDFMKSRNPEDRRLGLSLIMDAKEC